MPFPLPARAKKGTMTEIEKAKDRLLQLVFAYPRAGDYDDSEAFFSATHHWSFQWVAAVDELEHVVELAARA